MWTLDDLLDQTEMEQTSIIEFQIDEPALRDGRSHRSTLTLVRTFLAFKRATALALAVPFWFLATGLPAFLAAASFDLDTTFVPGFVFEATAFLAAADGFLRAVFLVTTFLVTTFFSPTFLVTGFLAPAAAFGAGFLAAAAAPVAGFLAADFLSSPPAPAGRLAAGFLSAGFFSAGFFSAAGLAGAGFFSFFSEDVEAAAAVCFFSAGFAAETKTY